MLCDMLGAGAGVCVTDVAGGARVRKLRPKIPLVLRVSVSLRADYCRVRLGDCFIGYRL